MRGRLLSMRCGLVVVVVSGALLVGCVGERSPASLGRIQATRGDVVAWPAVVRVRIAHGPWSDDIATGFVMGPGRVVTVAHVLGVDGMGATARIDRPGGGPGGLAARVVSIDERDDLAVLAVHGAFAVGTSSLEGVRGRPVVLALRGGRVLVVRARLRRSIIAHITTPDGRQVVDRPALELAAPIRAGDSGAPVVGADGRVVGVVFARSDGAAGVAYAVDGRVLGRL